MNIKDYYNHYKKIAQSLNKEDTAIKMLITELLHLDNIIFHYDEQLSNQDQQMLDTAINSYLYDDKPVQYILGYCYFYGLRLMVNSNVLIPRFDTEILVEQALQLIEKYYKNQTINIVDIGCGSGAIGIAIMKNVSSKVNCDAIDISKQALEVARDNAISNGVNINFIENDLLNNIDKKYDLIISNPPYIDRNDYVASDVLKYEPHLALFADDKGMYFYQQILKQSFKNLQKNGIILFEIGFNQEDLIKKLVNKYYPSSVNYIIKDYQNNPRVCVIINKE